MVRLSKEEKEKQRQKEIISQAMTLMALQRAKDGKNYLRNNPDKASEIGKLGAAKRWAKHRKEQENVKSVE